MKKVRAKIANILVNVANVLIRDIEDLQGVSLDENSLVKCTCGHALADIRKMIISNLKTERFVFVVTHWRHTVSRKKTL
jgi:hypothetical protein